MDQTIAKLGVCRICLIENVRMHIVVNKDLQDIYEKLTTIPLETGDSRPIMACYICYARLKSCYQFVLKCLESEEVFTRILNDEYEKKPFKVQGDLANFNGLSTSSVLQINIIDVCQIEEPIVKDELSAILEKTDDIKLKEEYKNEGPHADLLENDYPDIDDHHTQSDSEDDIPLTKIKTEVEKQQQTRKKRIKVRKKEKYEVKNSFKVDAHVISLTKEQQLENLLARSKSLNFINSPFKCDLCYKGFVDTRAYENHKLKHDVRSGLHICDVCSMRYRTAQHLRTHAVTAHARIFKCNKCGHTTHTANQARIHEKWHNGHTYECQLCSHTFRKPTSYLSHMRKRHPTEHVCNLCGESFVGKHGLQMHKSKTHTNDDKKENIDEPATERFCSECNIQFCSLEAWKRHILCSIKHTLRNEHGSQCKICGCRFTGSTSLSNHMREHARSLRKSRQALSSERPTSCNQCGSNFASRSKLQIHINRTHLGLKYNKNIVCEVCGKKCTSNATLKYHQRTHTGERPYSCTTCSKQFADSNQLRIHTRTHTGEKPYVCAVCGKRFTQKPALTRHYRVHTGAKPYTCQYCSRTFSQSNSLKLHIRTVHLKQPGNCRKKPQDVTQETKVEIIEKNGQELQAV